MITNQCKSLFNSKRGSECTKHTFKPVSFWRPWAGPRPHAVIIGARLQTSAEFIFPFPFRNPLCELLRTGLGWIPRRVVSAYDVVNASYLPTTINIYDLEIRSINNYRKSYDIASFLVSTKISRRCRFGNSKPCKYIRSSYVRRSCIYDNNRVSANISSYDYR